MATAQTTKSINPRPRSTTAYTQMNIPVASLASTDSAITLKKIGIQFHTFKVVAEFSIAFDITR
jgi:hypothetical protein